MQLGVPAALRLRYLVPVLHYEFYLRKPGETREGAGPPRERQRGVPGVLGAGETAGAVRLATGLVVRVRRVPDVGSAWEEAAWEGKPVGVDLAIPGEVAQSDAAAFLEWLFARAREAELVVFDPQLGRVVEEADTETVLERIRRHANYLLETLGASGVADAPRVDVDPPRTVLTVRAKLYLGLGIVLVLLAILAQLC